MKREFSAGGIVLRQAQNKSSKDEWEVLLIQHSSHKHWGFPKGHLEAGQTSEEAAVREVKEEGGVEAEIVGKIGQSSYFYTQKGEKIFKIVTIYLMKYISGDIKDHDLEVSDIGWFSVDLAKDRLSFNQDKKLLDQAFIFFGK